MRKDLFKNLLFWPLLFASQLIASALLSWHLAAQVNFAYPLGYKLLGLDAHIAEYAPLNRYRQGFEFTSAYDHWRLFGEICHSIQHSGEGLANITYQLPNGQATPLMHSNEIIHLQDVANLIDEFYRVGILAALLWIALLFIARQCRWLLPGARKILLGFSLGLTLATASVLLIGAKKVFYWAHEHIFPDGHQWFFYYQDSLMTTLMKAPDIFAFIAAFLLLLLISLWLLSFWGMNQLLNQSAKTNPMAEAKKQQHRHY